MTKSAALSVLVLSAAAVRAQDDGSLFWQHLDQDPAPYFFSATGVAETEFGDYGKTEMVEGSFGLKLARTDGFLWGWLDIDLGAHAICFLDNPGMKAIPDALLEAWIAPAYTLRFDNGWAWRVSAAPGVYSACDAPAFGCPASLSLFYAPVDELSFEFGATVRPGWDVPVVPNVGLAWEPDDWFRLVLACPESRLELFPRHILSFFGTAAWRNVTYALDDEDESMPDALTLDDVYVSAGASLRFFGSFFLTGEFGTFLERELSADVDKDTSIDLSKEAFVRVCLVGVF